MAPSEASTSNSSFTLAVNEEEEEEEDLFHEDGSPLLKPGTPTPESEHDSAAHAISRRRRILIVVFCVSIVAALDFGFFLMVIPLTRVYENTICVHYYDIHDPSLVGPGRNVAEKLCKIEPVQAELAFVRGYEGFFMALPSVLLAVPYGIMADKWGRRPVFLMSVLGLLLAVSFMLMVSWFWETFPLRFVWFSWAFTICGGGAAVAMAIVMTMIADVVDVAQRATVFFQIGVGMLLAQVGATSIASAIMDYWGPWTGICFGYGIGLLACCSALLAPETINYKSSPVNSQSLVPVDEESDIDVPPLQSAADTPSTLAHTLRSQLLALRPAFYEIKSFILQDWKVFRLLLTFFVNNIGVSILNIGLQYVSTRYGWSLAEAGFLFAIRGAANVLLFVAVLPGLTWILTEKFHVSAMRKDVWLARASVIFLPVGFFILALAPTPTVMALGLVLLTLGTGYASLIRSFVTSLVEPHHVGRLYTTITVFDTFGSLLSGPMLAALFHWGLSLGGPWIGIPFLAAGILTALTAVLVWSVRVPPERARRLSELDERRTGDDISMHS